MVSLSKVAVAVALLAATAAALVRLLGNIPSGHNLQCHVLGKGCPKWQWTGLVKPGWEAILDPVRINFERGNELGSHLTVYHHGKLVVDVATGVLDRGSDAPYPADAAQMVYSSTKVITSIVVAMLVDRGLLDLDAPIAAYWPAFAQGNKSEVTVADLMMHGGGVPRFSEPAPKHIVKAQGQQLREILERTELDPRLWRRTGEIGYHAISRGFFVNELCKIVDPKGRSVSEFAVEEIFAPLGFGNDFVIGLRDDHPLTAKVLPLVTMQPYKEVFGLLPMLFMPRSTWRSLLDAPTLTEEEITTYRNVNVEGTVSNAVASNVVQDLLGVPAPMASPEWRWLPSPSTHGFTRAAALARVANVLAMGGTDPETGLKILSKEILERVSKPIGPFYDVFFNLHRNVTLVGFGDVLEIAQRAPWFDERVFDGARGACTGWVGAGGSMINFCPEDELAFAYTMNLFSAHIVDWRAPSYLAQALNIARGV